MRQRTVKKWYLQEYERQLSSQCIAIISSSHLIHILNSILAAIHVSQITLHDLHRGGDGLQLVPLLALPSPDQCLDLVATQQQLAHQDAAHPPCGTHHQHRGVGCLGGLKLHCSAGLQAQGIVIQIGRGLRGRCEVADLRPHLVEGLSSLSTQGVGVHGALLLLLLLLFPLPAGPAGPPAAFLLVTAAAARSSGGAGLLLLLLLLAGFRG